MSAVTFLIRSRRSGGVLAVPQIRARSHLRKDHRRPGRADSGRRPHVVHPTAAAATERRALVRNAAVAFDRVHAHMGRSRNPI